MPPDARAKKELTTNSTKPRDEVDYNAASLVWANYLADSSRHNFPRKETRAATRNEPKPQAWAGLHTATRTETEAARGATAGDVVKFTGAPFPNHNQFRAKIEAEHRITPGPDSTVFTSFGRTNPFSPRLERPHPSDFLASLGLRSDELAGKRIVIDAGHGGSDSGATYGGLCEKDVTLDMAKLVADGLRRRGAEVIMTRDSDKTVELGARYMLTRQEHPDAFLSIHCNASPRGEDQSAYGIQTHFYAPKSAPYARLLSASLSNKLHESSLTFNNRGTFDRENSDFYVLKNQSIPSALVELGFVSNRKDRNLLSDPAYRQQLADALINAEVNYLTQPAMPETRYASNGAYGSSQKSKSHDPPKNA